MQNIPPCEQCEPGSGSGEREEMESCPISFGDFFTAPNTINLLNRTLFV